MQHTTFGFIGGGNIAQAIIAGLRKTNHANNIIAYAPSQATQDTLRSKYKVCLAKNNHEVTRQAQVVFLCIKPHQLKQALGKIDATNIPENHAFISVMAGVTCQQITNILQKKSAIIRAMPNTPCQIGAGVTGLYANQYANVTLREITQRIFQQIGHTLWVNNENDINSITAISGSGPAYFMLFTQYLMQSAIQLGITPDNAKTLAIATANGASQLMKKSDKSIQELIEQVTSPKGTTEAALQALQENDLASIIHDCVHAAQQRAIELSIDNTEN